MANLIRRRNEGEIGKSGGQEFAWDPFRMMDALLRLDPFRGSLDPGAGGWSRGGLGTFLPSFDLKETKDAYDVRVDLPGVKEEDLEVSVTGSVLTISGHRSQEHREDGDQYFAMERTYGSFSRAVSLPEGANLDEINAELKEGVLSLHIPKRPEVQPKRISVGSGAKSKA